MQSITFMLTLCLFCLTESQGAFPYFDFFQQNIFNFHFSVSNPTEYVERIWTETRKFIAAIPEDEIPIVDFNTTLTKYDNLNVLFYLIPLLNFFHLF